MMIRMSVMMARADTEIHHTHNQRADASDDDSDVDYALIPSPVVMTIMMDSQRFLYMSSS